MAARFLIAALIVFALMGALLSSNLMISNVSSVGGTGILSVGRGIIVVSGIELYDGATAASAFFDRVWVTMYVQDSSLAGSYEVCVEVYNDGAIYVMIGTVSISTSPARFQFLLPARVRQGLEVRVNVSVRKLS